MEEKTAPPVFIRSIRIQNYKGIEELSLEFPKPKMPDELDVVVMGSRNGVGKTSVLECCALMLMMLYSARKISDSFRPSKLSVDMMDLMVRVGKEQADLKGRLDLDDSSLYVKVSVRDSGKINSSCEPEAPEWLRRLRKKNEMEGIDDFIATQFIDTIGGMNPNPILFESFLYFHSYRKVQEGNPELGMIFSSEGPSSKKRSFYLSRHRSEMPMSTLKMTLLKLLMSRADLFENMEEEKADEMLSKINQLATRYAGGTIQKLKPSYDNTVGFRINPVDGGPSFPFDGLSSGQKEIISTLFLIWYHTLDKPCVVLIDEPELHLNPEWHHDFIYQLKKIAPHNQYIISTHSEDVFASVDASRRILLENPIREPK